MVVEVDVTSQGRNRTDNLRRTEVSRPKLSIKRLHPHQEPGGPA